MILTDEEIEKCRELAFHAAKKSQQSCKGQQVTPSDDYEYQFAWAIEAAILAKLNSAKPVAWCKVEDVFDDDSMLRQCGVKQSYTFDGNTADRAIATINEVLGKPY